MGNQSNLGMDKKIFTISRSFFAYLHVTAINVCFIKSTIFR